MREALTKAAKSAVKILSNKSFKFSLDSIKRFKDRHESDFNILNEKFKCGESVEDWFSTLLFNDAIIADDKLNDNLKKKLKERYPEIYKKLVSEVDSEEEEPTYLSGDESGYQETESNEIKMAKILLSLAEEVKFFKKTSSVKQVRTNHSDIRIENLKNHSQNVHEWFSRFETQTIDWSDEERGRIVPCFFEDEAIKTHSMIPIENALDYGKVKDYVCKKLAPPNFSPLLDFFQASQRVNEQIDQYAHRLISYIPIAPEKVFN